MLARSLSKFSQSSLCTSFPLSRVVSTLSTCTPNKPLRHHCPALTTVSSSLPTRSFSTPASQSYSMPEEDRYLFDLNGYIVVKNVFNPEEIQRANNAIDLRMNEMKERLDPAIRNTKQNSPLAGEQGKGRKDLGGILQWGADSEVFRRVLDHPALLPYYHDLLGRGYEHTSINPPLIYIYNRSETCASTIMNNLSKFM